MALPPSPVTHPPGPSLPPPATAEQTPAKAQPTPLENDAAAGWGVRVGGPGGASRMGARVQPAQPSCHHLPDFAAQPTHPSNSPHVSATAFPRTKARRGGWGSDLAQAQASVQVRVVRPSRLRTPTHPLPPPVSATLPPPVSASAFQRLVDPAPAQPSSNALTQPRIRPLLAQHGKPQANRGSKRHHNDLPVMQAPVERRLRPMGGSQCSGHGDREGSHIGGRSGSGRARTGKLACTLWNRRALPLPPQQQHPGHTDA